MEFENNSSILLLAKIKTEPEDLQFWENDNKTALAHVKTEAVPDENFVKFEDISGYMENSEFTLPETKNTVTDVTIKYTKLEQDFKYIKLDNRRTYLCNYCDYQSSQKGHINRHLLTHKDKTEDRRPFKCACPFCTEKFKDSESRNRHIFKYHKDSPGYLQKITWKIYECTLCEYKALKKSNYNRHMFTHSDSRNNAYVRHNIEQKCCMHCNYKTYEKGSLVRHVRLHGDERPYECDACGRRFNEKNTLDTHIVKKHYKDKRLLDTVKRKIHSCALCNYKDVNSSKLRRHMKRHMKRAKKIKTED